MVRRNSPGSIFELDVELTDRSSVFIKGDDAQRLRIVGVVEVGLELLSDLFEAFQRRGFGHKVSEGCQANRGPRHSQENQGPSTFFHSFALFLAISFQRSVISLRPTQVVWFSKLRFS